MAAVEDLLRWRAKATPRALAIKFGKREWSFSELEDGVSRAAGALRSLGVKEGDRVCLLLNPSDRYVVAVHAIARLGAVVVPLNSRQSPGELLWQIEDALPSLLVFDPEFGETKDAIEERSKRLHRWAASGELERREERVKGGSAHPERTHTIVYTSGTSGTPKGVELTLGNLVWNAVSFTMRSRATMKDRWLLVLPLYHVGGYTILFRSIFSGSAIVVKERFEPHDAVEAVEREGITLLSVVPTMLREMLNEKAGRFPASLRSVFLGGSPPPSSLIEEIRERKLPVVVTYGMTETCSQVALWPVLEGKGRGAYAELFPSSVRVSGGSEVGEIVVRGPTVSKGYWRNPVATRASFRSDGFHTGDLGRVGERGLVVIGRADDAIISGGEKIHPAEVESALQEHPSIREAVVLGLDDPRWGQRVEAVVVLKVGSQAPSEPELKAFLAERIGRYKIPKAYSYWESIPTSAMGKARRDSVRKIMEKRAR